MATINQIRLLVNDKSPNNILEDSDYTEILEIESNVYRAAALAARALSSFYATKVKTTIGKVSISNQQKFEHYIDLADKYDKRASTGKDDDFLLNGGGAPELTGVSNSEIDTVHEDDDRYKSAFRRGVLDNPSGSDNVVDTYTGEE